MAHPSYTQGSETAVMDEAGIRATLIRLADEILEQYQGSDALALVGIRTGGIHLAHRLAKIIDERGRETVIGELDITLYRDDLLGPKIHPVLKATHIPFDVTGRQIVLIDDVLFTGRTIRAAMDGIIDLGRPAKIQLAILVDRGHRELPIAANFAGVTVETVPSQMVHVRLREEGYPEDAVVVSS